ncbi:Outer membrane protein/protective antigen OMA87 [Vibrio jasicida]|uniref:Outer membrane protein/protective antigen OMA87 n=1 Tax=Vibrio jasicida TaxID=766224 RepID=A0AAU9QIG2_9VIBR|nr:Outer membrane protein/protective antigen OMA87 [Vibrio jasicida]CAH1596427.1 Outer membrane protein/protective antigen OMA87 [Vibrio jasicida]
MQNYPSLSALALSCAVLSTPSFGSFFDEVDGQFDMGHHIAENAVGFLPVPIIITEPAVGYGGGLVGVFMHETEQQKRERKQAALSSLDGGAQLMPAAVTAVGAAATQNGSWFAFAGHRHTWREDSIRYLGGMGLGQMNLNIYQDIDFPGLGPLPPLNTTVGFNTQTSGVALMQQLQFRVAKTPLMLGVKQIASYTNVASENSVVNKVLDVTLGDKEITSGLGLLIDYDTRNNLFYPTDGYQISSEYMVYSEALGGDSNYTKWNVSGQGYVPITEKWTLAFAGNYDKFDTSDRFVTPTTQPYIKLRGVSSFRYQGDQVMTAQTQVTYDIDHRWKVSAFYGVGVANAENQYAQNQTIDAYGGGFRYQIARRYGLFMGVDLARSDDENAFYISLGSGF